MTTTVHDFRTSTDRDDDLAWIDFYLTAFPKEYHGHTVVFFHNEPNVQRAGIDHRLSMRNGIETADVKARDRWYRDPLFEIYSALESRTLGWGLTAKCDWLATSCLDDRKGYIVRAETLRSALDLSDDDLHLIRSAQHNQFVTSHNGLRCQVKDAVNTKYTTRSIVLSADWYCQEGGARYVHWT